jgi:hypothetical protein
MLECEEPWPALEWHDNQGRNLHLPCECPIKPFKQATFCARNKCGGWNGLGPRIPGELRGQRFLELRPLIELRPSIKLWSLRHIKTYEWTWWTCFLISYVLWRIEWWIEWEWWAIWTWGLPIGVIDEIRFLENGNRSVPKNFRNRAFWFSIILVWFRF